MIKMKIAAALFVALAFAKGAVAQAPFLAQVEVEYEKTLNVKASYKAADPEWYDMVKDRLPNNLVTYHRFVGDTARSIYKPGREVPEDPRYWSRPIADKNVVYTDYANGTMIAQKPVFEETFLVRDSLPQIKWKLTADTRTIAGFECRKAIGILDDTVAIFAFYADEILMPGGPESIHGLPGLILGMGIPRLNTTWFATKVTVNGIKADEIAAPKKGKEATRTGMLKQLSDVLRQWGKWGSRMIVHYTI